MQLVGDLHQTAGVHAVVGRVEDPPRLQDVLDAWVGELVVRRTADDLGLQQLDAVVVDGVAERARGVDVEV